ncbi:alpha/beta hydrolase fold domain-containing protein [Nocardioides sp. TF02-7]|uniref:alpha/beta hydrolase fold domain-containing protein n=1 Tax=Nocardioides sp. TF02-7 TaxID=2917724 RepID=UPI001F05A7C9|nr:alpha/beta hydrolase fold domain-containing protein [Nocardioides sp. TF02-7]UMG91913.1 alpha/beta hydrolase [Nocardioides sp. TF02-7]
MSRLTRLRRLDVPTAVRPDVEAVRAEGPGAVVVRYQRRDRVTPSGALLWMHGGGLVAGIAEVDNGYCSQVAAELGVLVVGVDYRRAPEHPFPAALDDCEAAFRDLVADAARLGVDPGRVAVGGASAGGGLAAALCQRLRDRGGPLPALQLLRYLMLDDRTGLRPRPRLRRHSWTPAWNRFAWAAYLGRPRYGGGAVPPYAAAARARDLAGLPPAWIGVGSRDLFHQECADYAARLAAAGVAVELDVEPGMRHGADGDQGLPAMQRFRRRELAALAAAVGTGAAG